MYLLVQSSKLMVLQIELPLPVTTTLPDPLLFLAPELLLFVILLVCKVGLDTEASDKEWRDCEET
jgi:hypothetical protein